MRRGRVLVGGLVLYLIAGACGGSSHSGGAAPVASTRPGVSSTTGVPGSGAGGTGVGGTGLPGATVAGTTVAGTTVPTIGAPCGSTAPPPATYRHVVWIWMENHTWSQVLGDPAAAPYEASLARQCATAKRYASAGSPSLPNYIAATSGATQGISDDGPPASHQLAVDNLFRQVRTAGGTERTYAEDMATPCQLNPAAGYAVKHNPAAYYTAAADRAACGTDDLPLAAFDAGRLPTFAFVVPNLCHSTHDCGVASGDAWLAGFLPELLASSSYRSGTTAVFVVWDEYTPMPSLTISPTVTRGTVVTNPVDHYALLRTTEEMLGLINHLGAAAAAPSLRGPFHV